MLESCATEKVSNQIQNIFISAEKVKKKILFFFFHLTRVFSIICPELCCVCFCIIFFFVVIQVSEQKKSLMRIALVFRASQLINLFFFLFCLVASLLHAIDIHTTEFFIKTDYDMLCREPNRTCRMRRKQTHQILPPFFLINFLLPKLKTVVIILIIFQEVFHNKNWNLNRRHEIIIFKSTGHT